MKVRGSVSHRAAAGAIIAGLALTPPAVAAAGTLDQSQTTFNRSVDFGGQQVVGQTFTAGLSGNLDQVDVYVRFIVVSPQGTCNPGSGVTVEVRDALGGTPGSSVLASATVPPSSIPQTNFGFASFGFSPPATVAAGTLLTLVVSAPDSSCPTGGGGGSILPYSLGGHDGNPYAAGAEFVKTSGSWMPQADIDAAFQTYVVVPSPPATPGGTLPNPEKVLCAGRPSTQLGSNNADTLIGTPGPDVISGVGGNDQISGLSGNDLICGGSGKDKLKGGAGNDKLLGQAGKDTLKGGGAKDVCKGGKGNDSGKCEVEKSI